jgi:hypothetical protein
MCRILTGVALLSVLMTTRTLASQPDMASDVDMKAALLFNFAKFAEWPGITPGAPLFACIVGEPQLATALATVTRGQTVDGHAIDVRRIEPSGGHPCHMLYVAQASAHETWPLLGMLKGQPMLTISDAARFAVTGGMIELFVENGRMRFAVNVETVQRCQLRLSSRLLSLAKVVRNEDHGQ